MLDCRVKQRLETLGYAVDATEFGYYVTHHGQRLGMDGDFSEEAEANAIGLGARQRAELHRTYDNLAWDIALLHSKKYYLVLGRRGTHYDVYRGGMTVPCKIALTYAGAMQFAQREMRQGRCVQVVTQQINGTLHMEETET